MKISYIVWDWSTLKLMTESLTELKSYFKNLPKEEWDLDFSVWATMYNEEKYEVSYGMDWEPYILDLRTDELVTEEWHKLRDWLTTLPLDKEEFLTLNSRYYDFILNKNRNVSSEN